MQLRAALWSEMYSTMQKSIWHLCKLFEATAVGFFLLAKQVYIRTNANKQEIMMSFKGIM